ncbi:4Fe-4S binding protein [Thalassoroseus pseudoceratinae]|uniref:4Fe-4S binding protein n=1 Tax=Thalassoroseus pseudoceratinae TaxID=2713176 RepID=UPI001420CAD9|nr:4Fe-4S binding protein [Thalassoroseus pseudoceratinae]
MAQQSMLPAALQEVTEPLQDGDELLTADELNTLSLFTAMKKGGPDFRRFPSTTALRFCPQGRIICEQGQAGATAYYILTTEDVIALREKQLESIDTTIRAQAEQGTELELHPYFLRMTPRELERRRQEIVDEITLLKSRLEELPPVENEDGPQRQTATAHLLVNFEPDQPKRGLLHRLKAALKGGGSRLRQSIPKFIPIDAPTDINSQTLRGPLHEGELMGEMSCMNRAPRSATVVADRDCYMLEMLRNVLDMLHKDPAYKKRMDDSYRKRVLETHVRRLSIFDEMTDEQFARLKEGIELVEYESGATILEERADSDSFYIIRSGLVKVIKNAWYAFQPDEFTSDHWKSLADELAEKSSDVVDLREAVFKKFSPEIQKAIQAKSLTTEQQAEARKTLNDLVRNSKIYTKLGKTRKEVLEVVHGPALETTIAEYPRDTKKWSELEYRTFHRAFLEHIFPKGVPMRLESAGPRRTLAYLGRGDFFGEMAVFRNQPCGATCIAYDHPDSGYQQRIPDGRMGAIPSRVELIRIRRDLIEQIRNESPVMHERIQEEIIRREQSAQATVGDFDEAGTIPQSREFDQLGLVQGQKLMLIDLEKCTRCNACVEACVSAHDDGRTRLYLDGPRYENYLVPITCRKCLDPVCMIGCPVGSINRGSNGEIVIRDWCIGCRMCAEQCPYGSIQMNELRNPIQLSAEQKAILGEETTFKSVGEQAVVCDLCSNVPGQKPSCVYACPHDAAIRVHAQTFFMKPATDSRA